MKLFKTPVILLICAVIALSAVLAGCESNEPNFPVPLSNTSRSALELCTKPYKDSDLEDIYNYMAGGTKVNQLNDKYEIECLRKDEDGYRVIYEGKTHLLVLRFDKDGKWIETDKLLTIYRLSDTRGKFDKLQVGDPVTKVQTADPTCFFPFLVKEYGEPLETHHYTEDGYHTWITYDEDFNITSVTYELI